MYQKLIVTGNLGGDPELRYTDAGQSICNFSLASNRKWANQEGEPNEEVIWLRVTVWGRQAEVCHQYLSRGRQVLVEGRLIPDKETGGPRIWIDQNGNPRAGYEITALEVKFLGNRMGEDDGHDNDTGEPALDSAEDEAPFWGN